MCESNYNTAITATENHSILHVALTNADAIFQCVQVVTTQELQRLRIRAFYMWH